MEVTTPGNKRMVIMEKQSDWTDLILSICIRYPIEKLLHPVMQCVHWYQDEHLGYSRVLDIHQSIQKCNDLLKIQHITYVHKLHITYISTSKHTQTTPVSKPAPSTHPPPYLQCLPQTHTVGQDAASPSPSSLSPPLRLQPFQALNAGVIQELDPLPLVGQQGWHK